MASTLRQMRRQQERNDRKYAQQMSMASAEIQRAALYKNGITVKDLQEEYKRGWTDAKKEVEEFCFHVIYAAILIALNDNNLLSPDESADFLRAVDHQVVMCIEDKDLAEEAYEKTGITLQWEDPIERVQEK